jgi:hypothetical protein
MTKREELREQWQAANEQMPKDVVCEIDGYKPLTAVYKIGIDRFDICRRDDEQHVIGRISLSSDEATKLYWFLGGLYG